MEPKKEKSTEEETLVTELDSIEDVVKEENAAIKIQAAFRGHKARKTVKKMKSQEHRKKTEKEED